MKKLDMYGTSDQQQSFVIWGCTKYVEIHIAFIDATSLKLNMSTSLILTMINDDKQISMAGGYAVFNLDYPLIYTQSVHSHLYAFGV